VDVTVKSGKDWARGFAPNWPMVLGHKNHTALQRGLPMPYPGYPPLSDAEYTEQYQAIMRSAGASWRQLYLFGLEKKGRAVLCCYCADNQFCHTHLLIQEAAQRWPHRFQPDDAIRFNSKTPEWSWLSNFSSHPVIFEGTLWLTAEHAYQGAKCADPKERTKVELAPTPEAAKKLGGKVEAIPDWDTLRGHVMAQLLWAKFDQHPLLAERLLATGGRTLIHAAPWDAYWGDGPDEQGQNHMGAMLEEIRQELTRRVPV
jgi:ribA/ribD-fused uncharacterized protein